LEQSAEDEIVESQEEERETVVISVGMIEKPRDETKQVKGG
jgi:hypothetical protein